MKINKTPIPVLMFHSVRPASLISSHLSIPLEIFRGNMKALAENGYTTITLMDLYKYMSSQIDLPKKSICLTFDDGFLDNWVYAFPILKKYNLKATIFPIIDFTTDGPKRPILKPDSTKIMHTLETSGSLRWSELKEMYSSGIFDIQSHTITHARLFKSPLVKTFVSPSTNLPWLSWNLYPDLKKDSMDSSCPNSLPLGYPIFQFDRALSVRKFIPNRDFISEVLNYVKLKGGSAFFDSSDWENQLENYTQLYLSRNHQLGCYETINDQTIRINAELKDSKRILERNLEKKVDFLCWPGGGRSKLALQLSKSAGYLSTTCPSSDSLNIQNVPGENPFQFRRIGTCASIGLKGNFLEWGSPNYFLSSIDSYRKILFADETRKLYKLFELIKFLSAKNMTIGSVFKE